MRERERERERERDRERERKRAGVAGGGGGGTVAQSVERVTPGEEVVRLIPHVAIPFLLVGWVSV